MKEVNFMYILFPIAVYFLILCSEIGADRPCAARQIKNRSVVCVCNETYCDETTRVKPCNNEYITYTSSAGGSRFRKSFGSFKSCSDNINGDYVINLDVNKKYQKMIGFGGAVTDSAAMNWKCFPEAMQQTLVEAYYGEKGLTYNLARVPIACTDFSIRHYTYHDNQNGSFSLQNEDYNFKIPLLKKIIATTQDELRVFSASWTPPSWMKYYTETNPKCGFLKPEYYQAFADYLLKFVEIYEKLGIHIWGISTGNEPSLATFPNPPISCLGWSSRDMGNWIVNNLGPTIRNSKYPNLKLMALDDQRYTVPLVFNMMVRNNSKVLDYVDIVAVHYYSDSFISAKLLKHLVEKHPNLSVMSTEACAGYKINEVVLGSWSNAKKYVADIIEDLLNGVVAWVDWNLFLNLQGGPTVDKNNVDSPIIVDCKKKEFLKQPMYYALGHLAKFVPRGSYRIDSWSPPCRCSISNVAFLTPYNTVVVVLHNPGDHRSVTIKQGNKQALFQLEADSITTVEMLNE